MAKTRPALSVRLSSGMYAWRGRAVTFSKLPQREKFRWRSIRARRGWKGPPYTDAEGRRHRTRRSWAKAIEHTRKARRRFEETGDRTLGQRNWFSRDQSLPEWLFYYSGKRRKK